MKLHFHFRFVQLVAAVLTLSLPGPSVFSQTQKRLADAPSSARQKVQPTRAFESGEELVYVGEFSRSLLKKVDVADFRFTATRLPAVEKVSDKQRKNDEEPYLLKFTGDVTSKGFFAKLFNLKFRQQVESIVDPTSFTVTRTKKVDEQGKRARISETTYNDGKVVWVETDPNDATRPPRNVSASFVGQVQDVLSAIYFLRTQPLEVGKTFEITVSDSGVVYKVPLKVVEKKTKKSVLGRLESFRVDADVFGPDRLLSGDGQFSIWLTADNRQIPVGARIKIKYGTFDINLRKINRPTGHETLASTKTEYR
ncbi:MAG TPA: DUF3108 domain-containing protein [Pyrinomonadaceae bacterium]|nr:DUF3108 domain-containing protein [Pyrinomonadaceae bacterium]